MSYVSIRVSTLRGEQKIDFNAYLKINGKMLLYLRRGDSFEGERLNRLKDKKLKKMFILDDEENKYREYLQKNIEMAYDEKSGKDIVARAEIVQGQQQSNAEEVFEDPNNIEAYSHAKEAASKYVQFLMGNSKAVGAIMNILNEDFSVAHHGVNVSGLSIALAQKLNMIDPKQNQLLALGALLHDIGLNESGIALNRPRSDFSREELLIYKQHPTLGTQKVREMKHFDNTVLKIIAQHEEHIDGSGFPTGARESELDPLSILVSSANALDRLLTFEKIPRHDAVKKLMIEQVGCHPLNQIQLLGEIVKGF